jgi:redox-sensitive bicupin YhaK (pirin superfamily)
MFTILGKPRDLGDGFTVSRILPQAGRRSVGPFVFFDYFGPVDFPPGRGIDVRPHPHIGLATVTYLFEGSQVHRDSLGSVQEIAPGDVNWMTAGRGIVHSERTGPDVRAAGHRLHGIQSWVGLPLADEETAPEFQHIAAAHLPQKEEAGVRLRIIAGSAFGLASPVRVFSGIFYADARFDAGGNIAMTDDHEERAVFVVEGDVQVAGESHGPGTMVLLDPGTQATVTAFTPARVMFLGGAPLDGARHLWWNFVSSSMENIERAKRDWKERKFGTVAGDPEFIPLPE